MSKLIETLAAQLERSREVTVQVSNYLTGAYEVDRDALGTFFAERLPGLEDYEHDLILSPLFTPKLADQAIFADVLGRESVARERWPDIIQELAARPTRGRLVTSDGKVHTIPLREVTIERYVHRLRLEGTIDQSLLDLLERVSPAADSAMLKAVARRAIWEGESRRGILVRYLTSAGNREGYRLADCIHLLDIVESYKPPDVAALVAMIPPWQEALRQEIDTAGYPKPFFTSQTQGEHGGDRDQRTPDERRIEAKRNEMAALGRIQQILAD